MNLQDAQSLKPGDRFGSEGWWREVLSNDGTTVRYRHPTGLEESGSPSGISGWGHEIRHAAKTQTHEEWIASLKPGDEVEWRRGERDFDSPDGAWARGAYVGSTDTYRHVVSGWFVSPENIRPVQRDAKPVYVPVDLRVDTPTRFAAHAPASSSSFVSDGSSWHPIPAREAGTDHGWAGIGTPPPKRDYVHDYEGTAVATMHGKTVALCADGRIVVDGEVYVSAVRMDAKDAEAIAKRDAIIAELTERVRVLTPKVEVKHTPNFFAVSAIGKTGRT